MKLKFGIVITLCLVLTIILSIFKMTRETANWDFIQQVGGISISSPFETEKGYYLPVNCNVSGLDSITIKPVMLNSALFCLNTKSTIENNKIYLRLTVGIPILNDKGPKCEPIRLGNLEKGSYQVYYGKRSSENHQIGSFIIQ